MSNILDHEDDRQRQARIGILYVLYSLSSYCSPSQQPVCCSTQTPAAAILGHQPKHNRPLTCLPARPMRSLLPHSVRSFISLPPDCQHQYHNHHRCAFDRVAISFPHLFSLLLLKAARPNLAYHLLLETVLDRLASFLPQIEAANAQLATQAQTDPSSVHVELPEDSHPENGSYIEMVRSPNLGSCSTFVFSPSFHYAIFGLQRGFGLDATSGRTNAPMLPFSHLLSRSPFPAVFCYLLLLLLLFYPSSASCNILHSRAAISAYSSQTQTFPRAR